jgi:F420-non-reducing hydrogenase iron-sulfur subunit
VKSILESLGLEKDRIWFRYIAHGEGKRFVDTATEFNDYIKKIGPNPLKERGDT